MEYKKIRIFPKMAKTSEITCVDVVKLCPAEPAEKQFKADFRTLIVSDFEENHWQFRIMEKFPSPFLEKE